jgi:hypothetical protein
MFMPSFSALTSTSRKVIPIYLQRDYVRAIGSAGGRAVAPTVPGSAGMAPVAAFPLLWWT